MSATLLEPPKVQMTTIFPTTPGKVNIQLLPKEAEFISYSVDDAITISAWMPDGFHKVRQEQKMSNDSFYDRYCDGCNRNCYDYLNDIIDDDDDIDWSQVPGGEHLHCNVYDNGYGGQYCPQGNDKEEDDIEFEISNMVFEISLSHLGNNLERFSRVSDSAFLCGGIVGDGVISCTTISMASNVFGEYSEPGGICWGYNTPPNNLREIVSSYCNTPFNNDLFSIGTFEQNCYDIREYVKRMSYYQSYSEKLLTEGADALLLVDAENNVSTFFQFLSAGFKQLPEAPHIMIIPVYECVFDRNGHTYTGYQTKQDAVGKSWFITSNGLVIGQV